MEKRIKYSVFRYSPSKVAGEIINLGILFFALDEDYRDFKYSKRLTRLAKFDDEVSIEMVRSLLSGIQKEVRGDLFSYDSFDIDEFTKFYVNDFFFDAPKIIAYEDLRDITERLHRLYFRFEYAKEDRPTERDDKDLLERIIRSNGTRVLKNHYVLGYYDEKVRFDFVTDEYYVKVFDFDEKDLSRMINSAKVWAWNSTYHKEGKEVLLIYRFSDRDPKESADFQTIKRILEDSKAKIVNIEDSIKLLQNAG